jgi:hypothetical protein
LALPKLLYDGNPLVYPTRDAARANEVVNNHTVLPYLSLGLYESLDVTPLVENPRNHLLMGEFGGCLIIWSAPGVYDCHDFVLPEGRGKWARDAAQDVFDFVFGKLGARMLWTQTPVENRASRMFNRIIGFTSHGVHPVQLPNGETREFEYFIKEVR